ncbi:MAG: hypothetical protein HQK49_15540 [Oligoflexia bacterium]|nr:hypothetical protein [Oligoflexia bacterium]
MININNSTKFKLFITLVALIVIIFLGFWFRVSSFDSFVHNSKLEVSPSVTFTDPDSYYHMRRAEWTKENYPHTLSEDNYIYYPGKGIVHWPGGFDLLLGSILKITSLFTQNTNNKLLTEQIISFFNPTLSVITMIIIFIMFKRYWGIFPALLSTTMISISNAHINYSAYANVDHHTINAFFVLIIALLMYGGFSTTTTNTTTTKTRAHIITLGTAVGLFQFFHVSFANVNIFFILLLLITIPLRLLTNELNSKLKLYFFTTTISIFLFSLTSSYGRQFLIEFEILSLFHVLIPLLGLLISLCFEIYKGTKTNNKLNIVAAIIIATIFIFSITYGHLFKNIIDGIRYTMGDNWFFGLSSESKSPFYHGIYTVFVNYSFFIIFIPFIYLYLLYQIFKGKMNLSTIITPSYTILIIITGLYQLMFSPNAVIALTIFFSATIAYLFSINNERKNENKNKNKNKNKIFRFTIILLSIICIIPMIPKFSAHAQQKKFYALYLQDTNTFASYLKKISPPTSGFFDQTKKPEYSIMANRDLGHLIIYRAQRPIITSPFAAPHYFINFSKDFARFELAQTPEEGKKYLDKHLSKYVINSPLQPDEIKYYANLINYDWRELLEIKNNYHQKDKFFTMLNARLYAYDGSSMLLNAKVIKAVDYLRLLYESDLKIFYFGELVSRLHLYEVVKAATIVGSNARAGAFVNVYLKMQSNAGRTFIYSNFTFADKNGNWSLKFPYPSEINYSIGIIPLDKVKVEIAGETSDVDISERDVILGQTITI